MRGLRHEGRCEIRQPVSVLRVSGSILLHGVSHKPGGICARENSIEMGFQQISRVEFLIPIAGSDDVGPAVPSERLESAAIQANKAARQNETSAHEVILSEGFLIRVSIRDQPSRRAEERAELHHQRSACVLDSRLNKRQARCAVRPAAGARPSLLRTYCRLRVVPSQRICLRAVLLQGRDIPVGSVEGDTM